MNWHRLELWVTIAFGVAAGLALAILSIKFWAPEDWWLRQLIPPEAIKFLIELGDVSGGLIVIIFILILGGTLIMTVLLHGYEKLAEVLAERKRRREEEKRRLEEARAAGRATGLAEGLAEGLAKNNQEWEAWARQLIKEGKLPSEVQFPFDSTDPEP